MCKTNVKCSVCHEKNAWIISPEVEIPIYCRKCYIEKVLPIKYLHYFCKKCGHKRNRCMVDGSDGNSCFGCWFKQKNVHKSWIRDFYNSLNRSENKTPWDISDFISQNFDIYFCSCNFIYSREHRC